MHLNKLTSYHGCNGPLLVVIADGVGLAPAGPANAVALAHTPTLDRLLASTWQQALQAHGVAVGLPSDQDMGNSEVGHNTLGGGRVFDQGAKLVNRAFADGSLFNNPHWQRIEAIGAAGGTVHFLGLLSDGNVHAHLDHLINLLQRCAHAGIAGVAVHVLLDGRDVAPRSALTYLQRLETVLTELNRTPGRYYRIASGGGRMRISMDRYGNDWPMVKLGYDTHVHAVGTAVSDAMHEVQRQYDQDPEITDQTLAPFVVVDANAQPVGRMRDGDALVLFNFRGDRAIQFSQAMGAGFEQFERGDHPEVFYCGMLQYDGDLHVPERYLVEPPVIERPMMQYLCAEKIPSFAVSETQKFGHVTFFWNGNRSGYLDRSLETYIEIPSDRIACNHAPRMKADEITQATVKLLRSGDYRFGRINFANGDMVGHTGDLPATVAAIETVDHCLGRLVDVLSELDGILIFTADHGNADQMYVESGGVRTACTSHTLNPVPFVIVDGQRNKPYVMRPPASDSRPGLANVAATVFNLMGYHAPDDYAPSLIELPGEPVAGRG